MSAFATAGGPGPGLEYLSVCCCFFHLVLVGFLAVNGARKKSYWRLALAAALAVTMEVLTVLMVIDTKPSDDPDESHVEGLAWFVLAECSIGPLVVLASVVWVIVARNRYRPVEPPPPNPSA